MCANKCCLYEHAFKYLLFFKILETNGYKNMEIIGNFGDKWLQEPGDNWLQDLKTIGESIEICH
jgi:hypothetical protein